MKKSIILVCLLWLFSPLQNFIAAQQPASKVSAYTRLILKEAEKRKDTPILKALSGTIPSTYLPAFVTAANDSAWDILRAAGCRIRTKVNQRATVNIPYEKVAALSKETSIRYIEAATPVKSRLDSAHRVSNTAPVYAGTGLKQPYTGSGIVVGIVDTGFDLTHPNLYDASGQHYRVKYYWKQVPKTETDENVPYGTLYTKESEIRAIGTDQTDNYHGTHVMGIAAGTGYDTPYHGVAPESDLYLVTGSGLISDMADVADGVSFILSKAEEEGKPCVVNLSVGSHFGPMDGTSAVDQMISDQCGPGRIVVAAAGNERTNGLYIEKGIETDTLYTFLPDNLEKKVNYIECWKDLPDSPLSISIGVYDLSTRQLLDHTRFISTQSNAEGAFLLYGAESTPYQIQYLAESLKKMSVVIEYPDSYPKNEVILLKTTTPQGLIRLLNITENSFSDCNLGKPFQSGIENYSLCSPGTAEEVVCVGAYSSKNEYTTWSGKSVKYNFECGDIAEFSSIGPTWDGRIKPDVTAPGFWVCSSINSFYTEKIPDQSLVAKSTFKGREYSWATAAGTSMATPFVTGSIALWLQARPSLSPDDIKEVFKATAMQDKYTDAELPSNVWGYGKIDVYKGLLKVLGIESDIKDLFTVSPQEAMSVYTDGTRGTFHIRWTNAPEWFTSRVYDPNGSLLHTEKVETPVSADHSITLGQIPSGVYIIQIQTKEGTVERKLKM